MTVVKLAGQRQANITVIESTDRQMSSQSQLNYHQKALHVMNVLNVIELW